MAGAGADSPSSYAAEETTPSSSGAAAAARIKPALGRADADGNAACWYGCGTFGATGDVLTNDATNVCPRWVCRQCKNTALAMVRAFRTEGLEVLQAINTMKKHHTDEWKEKVRAARLLPAEERKQFISTQITSLDKKIRIKDSNPIVWLTKSRYKAFQAREEGMSIEAAEAKWENLVTNRLTPRKYAKNGEVMLAVQDNPRTTGEMEIEQRRSLETSCGLAAPEDVKNAQDWVMGLGAEQTFQDEPFLIFGSNCLSTASGAIGDAVLTQGRGQEKVDDSEPHRFAKFSRSSGSGAPSGDGGHEHGTPGGRELKRRTSQEQQRRRVLPRKTTGLSKVENAEANLTADVKNAVAPFLGAKGFKKSVERKMQQLKGVAAHEEIQDLEAEAAKTVQTIGEVVAQGTDLIKSFSNMKAP